MGNHFYSYSAGSIIGQYNVGSRLGVVVSVSHADGTAAGHAAIVTLRAQTAAHPRVFNHPNIAPITVYEGDYTPTLDLSAYNPYGGPAPFYDLGPGSPGSVNNVGTYYWHTQPGDAGTHWVTVVASFDPQDAATISFQVNVLTHVPHIDALYSDHTTIDTSGNQQITLTAANVTDPKGNNDLYNVCFYQDTDNNGQLDRNVDQFFGYGTYVASTNSAYVSGYVVGVTPETATFFAYAENLNTDLSNVVKLTLKVVAAPANPSLVTPVGAPTSTGASVHYDQSGNLAVVGFDSGSSRAVLRRYDPAGTFLGSAVTLSAVQANPVDIDALPDGHFIVLWLQSTLLKAQEYNADGTVYGSTYQWTAPSTGDAKVAIAAPGDFAVISADGFYGTGQVTLYRYAQGALVRSQVLSSSGESADVAMGPDGTAVAGWIDFNSQQAKAQRIGSDGSLLGSTIVLSSAGESVSIGYNPSLNLTVAVDELGRFAVAWMANGGIMARRYLADGTPVDASDFRVNDSIAAGGREPVADFRHGKLVVTWSVIVTGYPNYTYALTGQAYSWDNTLRPLGGNFSIATGAVYPYAGLAIDPQGQDFAVGVATAFQRYTGLNTSPQGFGLANVAPLTGSLCNIQTNLPAGTTVGQLQSNAAGPWTWRLVAGDGATDNGLFQLVNNQLMTNGAFDFQAKTHYTIRVQAMSAAGTVVEQVFNLNAGNLAPSLGSSVSATLPPVPHDSTDAAGSSVASFADAAILEQDLGGLRGVALEAAQGSGTWQYSLDGGSSWTGLPAVSASAALLLRDSDQVRFVPVAGFLGAAVLTFAAWDRTTGTAGGTADLTRAGAVGGASAFSSTTATATLQVARTLAPVVAGAAQVPANRVSSFLAALSDGDVAARRGIAVTGLGGDGTWQFSLNGGATWSVLGPATLGSARLLRDTDLVRFLPAPTAYGIAYLQYQAWDRSSGAVGGRADLTRGTGGATTFSTAANEAALVIRPVNHAPTWTRTSAALTPVAPGTANPPGDSIAQLVGPAFNDRDDATAAGVAVVALGGTASGTWQYSTDGGNAWTPFGDVAPAAARLLSGSDRLRFVPAAGFAGTVTMQLRAWDGTLGNEGEVIDLGGAGLLGGSGAFSTTVLRAACLVNSAPALGTLAVTLPAMNEDAAPSAPVSAAALLASAGYTDADGGARTGLAVTGFSGPGTWQVAVNGTTFVPLGSLPPGMAQLLSGAALLRIAPAPHQFGTATLLFRAWDQTVGTVGSLLSSNVTGGASALSSAEAQATLAIDPVNHAPTWAGAAATFTPVLPDDANPAGDTVAAVFGAAFRDLDAGTVTGSALVGSTGHGVWQYSTDGGNNWSALGTVTAGAARLLSGNDRLRFLPAAGFIGTATLQAAAWDGSGGADGSVADARLRGGATPFSTMLLSAPGTVNTAPALATGGPTLPAINEGNGPSARILGSTLLAGATATDADATARKGLAVVGADGPGTWQVSLDGGASWRPVGTVSEQAARLLSSTARLRVVPDLHGFGTARLTYGAWDQTAGAAGELVTVTATGGASALSAAEASATLVVNHVNGAPSWTGGGVVLANVRTNDANPGGATVADLFAGSFTDPEPGDRVGIAVTAVTGAAGGTWQFSTDAGASWTPFGAVALRNALLLSGADPIRFLPEAGFAGQATFRAYPWDGTTGNDGNTADLRTAGMGGAHAFGTGALTATVLVNAAPTLTGAAQLLHAINEDAGPSAPVSVATLLAGAGYADPDAGALKGLDIVSATGPGTWQYSTDNTQWHPVPTPRLLLGVTGALRFLSSPHQVGTATLSFRAWDQTSGNADDVTTLPISTTVASASLQVNHVNHAPSWAVGSAALSPVLTGAVDPPGDRVGDLFANVYRDVDTPNASAGIAVTGLTGAANGTWQYSTDAGGSWHDFGTVATRAVRLLGADDRVRFVPRAGFTGTVRLQALAWDGTTGSRGATVDLTGAGKTGGASAFGTTRLTVSCLVNAAPVLGS